jgi:hypothetical protein
MDKFVVSLDFKLNWMWVQLRNAQEVAWHWKNCNVIWAWSKYITGIDVCFETVTRVGADY